MLKKLMYALEHTRAASLHAARARQRAEVEGFNNAERENFYIRA